jgi:hypothetical protein
MDFLEAGMLLAELVIYWETEIERYLRGDE